MTKRSRKAKNRRRSSRKPRPLSSGMELLESRQLLALVLLGNTSDIVDGNTASISDLISSPGPDGISLREAILASNNTAGFDNIALDPAFAGGTIRLNQANGPLTISDHLSFNGMGIGGSQVVITGDSGNNDVTVGMSDVTDAFSNSATSDNVRVFEITSGQVALSGMTLTGGVASGAVDADNDGGAILVRAGAELNFSNGTIAGNRAIEDNSFGGAINNLGTVTVDAAAISGNLAGGGGGAINNSTSDTLTVMNSVLSGNATDGAASLRANGGAISNYGTATLIDTTVSNNTAGNDGGGIANRDTLIVTKSSFSGNRANGNNSSTGDGGGIHNRGAATLLNVTLDNNSSTHYGGGFNNSTGEVASLTNVTLAGNESAQGGALSNFGDATLTNSTLSGNSAVTAGGGIFTDSGRTTTLQNSILMGNDAPLDSESSGAGTLSLVATNVVGMDVFQGGMDVGTTIATEVFANTHTVGTATAGTLADNGGAVSTIALRAATVNPALDAGDSSLLMETTIDLNGDGDTDDTISVDARSFARTEDFPDTGPTSLDLGAFEQQFTLVVDTNVDSSDGNFTPGQRSLREAIELANLDPAADTITFDPASFSGAANSLIRMTNEGTLVLSADVTIDASTATDVVLTGDLDGDDITLGGSYITDVFPSDTTDNIRVFNLTDGTANLKGLTVTGGAVGGTDDGGAFLVSYGATLNVTDSVISGNSAGDFGGAINNFGTLALDNVMLSGNVAYNGGGAINNSTNDTLVMTNSTVTGNWANERGGGIVNYGSTSISNSEVRDNTAASAGGGIHNSTGDLLTMSHVVVSDNTLQGNTAPAGAGVSNLGNATLNAVAISNNTGAWYGGGMYNRGAARLSDVTLTDNSALRGGGIHNDVGGALELVNGTLAGNIGYQGGAIHNLGSALLLHATISGNTASDSGGGIFANSGGTTDLQNTLVLGNNAPASAEAGGPGTVNFGADSIVGGGDSVTQLVFANTQNTVGVLSGELADNGGAVETIALRNATDNPALDISHLLQMVLTTDATGQPRVIDVSGVDNGGVIDAGAYELQNGTPPAPTTPSLVVTTTDDFYTPFDGQTSLREAIQYANSGTTPADTDGDPLTTDTITFDTSLSGSTIQLNGTALEIIDALTIDASALTSNVVVEANQSSRVLNFSATTGDLSLNALTITNGQTSVGDTGGGIRFLSSGNLTLTNSIVSGNFAGSGGGIYANTGDVTLDNSTVSGNSVYLYGGGIFARNGSVNLTDSTVGGNTSQFNGGGIYADSGDVTLTNTTVSGNSAIEPNDANGGGIFTDTGAITLTGSTVSGNSADFGGGIYSDDGDVTLIGSTVGGNFGRGNGGGIYADTGNVSLTSSTVSGNSSEGKGGGIYADGGDVTIENSTLSGNSSNFYGGGIHSEGATLISSTVTGNSAGDKGGGVFVISIGSSRSLAIHNSIVAGNVAPGTAYDIGTSGMVTLAVDYSLIGIADGLTLGGTDNLSGTEAAPLDAQLAALANNGGPTQTHALLADSPALNAGDPTAVAGQNGVPEFDQRGMGFDRVQNGRIDMGAFEQQPTSPSCDFDGDFDCDIDDIDAMIMEIAAGTNNMAFDLTGEGIVDLADRDQWLADAGAINLPSGNPYLLGDANLDGVVDGQDFLSWNDNKFTSTGKWSQGDWNADGVTDGQDFLEWNDNKFSSSDMRSSNGDDEQEEASATRHIDSIFAQLYA